VCRSLKKKGEELNHSQLEERTLKKPTQADSSTKWEEKELGMGRENGERVWAGRKEGKNFRLKEVNPSGGFLRRGRGGENEHPQQGLGPGGVQHSMRLEKRGGEKHFPPTRGEKTILKRNGRRSAPSTDRLSNSILKRGVLQRKEGEKGRVYTGSVTKGSVGGDFQKESSGQLTPTIGCVKLPMERGSSNRRGGTGKKKPHLPLSQAACQPKVRRVSCSVKIYQGAGREVVGTGGEKPKA